MSARTSLLVLATQLVALPQQQRQEAAARLAQQLGANDLLVFIPDAETGTLLPAPGFVQTLPEGRVWRAFLATSVTAHEQTATLPYPTTATLQLAYGLAANGAVLVLLGGAPPYPGLTVLREVLPLLAAAFRGEQQAALARGEAAAAETASAQAQALAAALDGARQALQEALNQAADALQVRDTFLGSVSHDLRNPLTTIVGQSQLLLRQAGRGPSLDSARVRTALQSIEASAARMSGMIDELLDLTRLQSGRALDLHLEPVDAVTLVRQVVEEQQAGTAAHAIAVVSTLPALPVYWDKARMQRVLTNLVDNALKYSPAGGSVTVGLTAENGAGQRWVELTVQDQGLGIPATDLPHVFERFYRAANVRGHIKGIGLGLAGAREIVERHGGVLTVSSQEGSGTRVTARLPPDAAAQG